MATPKAASKTRKATNAGTIRSNAHTLLRNRNYCSLNELITYSKRHTEDFEPHSGIAASALLLLHTKRDRRRVAGFRSIIMCAGNNSLIVEVNEGLFEDIMDITVRERDKKKKRAIINKVKRQG